MTAVSYHHPMQLSRAILHKKQEKMPDFSGIFYAIPVIALHSCTLSCSATIAASLAAALMTVTVVPTAKTVAVMGGTLIAIAVAAAALSFVGDSTGTAPVRITVVGTALTRRLFNCFVTCNLIHNRYSHTYDTRKQKPSHSVIPFPAIITPLYHRMAEKQDCKFLIPIGFLFATIAVPRYNSAKHKEVWYYENHYPQ